MEFDRFRTFTNQALLSRYKQSARARKKKKTKLPNWKLRSRQVSQSIGLWFEERRIKKKKKQKKNECLTPANYHFYSFFFFLLLFKLQHPRFEGYHQ